MRKLEIADAEVMQLAIRQEIDRSEESRYDHLRIPRHAGPQFRRMSVHRSAASRSSIPRHVGPVGDAG